MSAPWWAAAPPAQAQIPCTAGVHVVRWAGGQLTADDHRDAEGELVLAALGGEKAECVAVVAAWRAHRDDLDVLALGPRSPADELAVTWEMVSDLRSRLGQQQAHRLRGAARLTPRPGSRQAAPRIRSMPMRRLSPEAEQAQASRADLLSLFALGRDFQVLLSGEVAAVWSAQSPAPGARRDLAAARPALTAALAGRLAPAAASWLGIDPDVVDATLHEGPGWGSIRRDGTTLRASLPTVWLARVWAPGFPVVAGHLVVEVLDAAWPTARVRGLRRPDEEPVVLSIRHDGEHWMVS
jgi:hypothetical protein